MKRDVRGLSPVVATILLIFLVLILASIVFLWARGFLAEQLEKEGVDVTSQCGSVVLSVSKNAIYGTSTLALDLANNGQLDVYGISVKERWSTGDDIVNFHAINLGSGNGQVLEVDLHPPVGSGSVPVLDDVVVYPVLLANIVGKTENKEYTCLDSGTILNV